MSTKTKHDQKSIATKPRLVVDNDKPRFPDVTSRGAIDARSWRNVEALFDWLELHIARNEFTGIDEVDGERLDDDLLIELVDEAHRAGLRVTRDFMLERVRARALENRYHPVRDYFDKLDWDGKPRLDTWLSTYLGAVNSEYTRAVGRIALIAAVRRIRRPGTKFDTLPILEGDQGTGKSSALAILAVKQEWFTDCLSLTFDPKVIIEQTEGKLIVEIPELSGMRKAEVEHVKANLSRTHDRARLAYGRLTTEVPRQFVMIATTNVDDDGRAYYLKDHTGNRRFLPVRTGDIDLKGLRRNRDQIWAEAVEREANGESITLPVELWSVAERKQKSRMERNAYFEKLRDTLGSREGKVLIEDLWSAVGKTDASKRYQNDFTMLGQAMKELGWRRKRLRFDGDLAYWYVKGEEPWKRITFSALGKRAR